MTDPTKEELERFMEVFGRIAQAQSTPVLDEEDRRALAGLVPHVQALVEFAEYQKAQSLIIKKWRGLVIGLAAFLTAAAVLWQNFSHLITAAVKP